MDSYKPNTAEFKFLSLAYNRFYDLYSEVMKDQFWIQTKWERYSKIKQAFSIYSELLNYEPLKEVIKDLKKLRPPMESEIGSELFKFIRNLFSHFPFYESWEETCIDKSLVNWNKAGLTMDKFLSKYEGHEEIKYRFWEPSKKKMTYLSIRFPKEYNNNSKIYLKDILTENEGVKFSFILMRKILDTQIESIEIIN